MEASDIKYTCQISVGMPVWGVEKYIRRCLMSILDQEFDDMIVHQTSLLMLQKKLQSAIPKGKLLEL